MIQRRWKATARPGREGDYLRHLRTETFPALSRIPGFLRATVSRALDGEAPGRLLVVTEWESMEAVKAFGGESPERAVVPPPVEALMLEHDDRVEHCEVLATYGADGEASWS